MNKRAIQPLFKVSCYLLLSLFLVAGWWGGGSIGPASAIAASGFFGTSDNVCEYWKAMFDFGVRIAGAFAFLFVVFAGAYWMFSAGDAKKVEKAKEMIGGALTGLALALLSYVLFWALNPYLTECKIEISELQMVSPSREVSVEELAYKVPGEQRVKALVVKAMAKKFLIRASVVTVRLNILLERCRS